MVKKARREKPYDFNKKGHKQQYEFIEKVVDVLEEAQTDAEAIPSCSATSSIKKHLQEGVVLLEERQKLIKIADRSEFGWGVVSEYQSDELAKDSDDEKRLNRAEKAAEKKAAARMKKKADKGKFARRKLVSNPPPVPTGGYSVPAYGAPSRGLFPQLPLRPSASFRQVGPCHNCGDLGHHEEELSQNIFGAVKF